MAINDLSKQLFETADGSFSISIPDAGLSYHSRHGALSESKTVYIEQNLLPALEKKEPLNVLEVGMGTGLNALLTLKAAIEAKKTIHYHALEPFPLEASFYKNLRYTELEGLEHLAKSFFSLHEAKTELPQTLDPFFIFTRYASLIQTFESPLRFDVIYFDPFAPLSQPEIWTTPVFEKLFNMTVKGGTLSTYSSKTEVRHAMQAAGYEVRKVPGPYGKREILVATKPK